MSTVRNRAKDLLPQVLLTLMSIIQALALEFLWDDVRVAERALRWDAVSTWFQIFADMLAIMQVWLLYTSATMRVRWTPSMRDLMIPFLIGILEFLLIDVTGPNHRGLWFLTLAAVYTVASWDAQSVFSRARLDPDNAEFFRGFTPRARLRPLRISAHHRNADRVRTVRGIRRRSAGPGARRELRSRARC